MHQFMYIDISLAFASLYLAIANSVHHSATVVSFRRSSVVLSRYRLLCKFQVSPFQLSSIILSPDSGISYHHLPTGVLLVCRCSNGLKSFPRATFLLLALHTATVADAVRSYCTVSICSFIALSFTSTLRLPWCSCHFKWK